MIDDRMRDQWWLAELDQYGNPKLIDGAHSDRQGADQAFYLFQRLGFAKPGRRLAVTHVQISEPIANSDGVNEGAIDTINSTLGKTE